VVVVDEVGREDHPANRLARIRTEVAHGVVMPMRSIFEPFDDLMGEGRRERGYAPARDDWDVCRDGDPGTGCDGVAQQLDRSALEPDVRIHSDDDVARRALEEPLDPGRASDPSLTADHSNDGEASGDVFDDARRLIRRGVVIDEDLAEEMSVVAVATDRFQHASDGGGLVMRRDGHRDVHNAGRIL